MASLLAQAGAVPEAVAPEVGTVAGAGREAAITAASLSKAGKSAWCRREHGADAAALATWRTGTTAALAGPEQTRASPEATHTAHKRIKAFDRDLLRRARAPAQTAPLLVLSKG